MGPQTDLSQFATRCTLPAITRMALQADTMPGPLK
jgi:hypothetical protein